MALNIDECIGVAPHLEKKLALKRSVCLDLSEFILFLSFGQHFPKTCDF